MAMGSGRVFARRASWGVHGLPRGSLSIYLSLGGGETARRHPLLRVRRGFLRRRPLPRLMPIKTKDGWASNGQISRQEKAWAKARSTMMAKLGDAMDDLTQLNSKSKEIFDEMDTDKNGSIDPNELKEAMRQAGINLTKKEVQEMITQADADGDDLIDLGEFQALMRAEVRKTWRIADRCRRAATSVKPAAPNFCLCCSATSVVLPLPLCYQLPCAAPCTLDPRVASLSRRRCPMWQVERYKKRTSNTCSLL